MNPNNNNLQYLLNLPTPRLLQVFKKVRSQIHCIPEWEWGNYRHYVKEQEDLPDNARTPRFVPRLGGGVEPNPLYMFHDIENLVDLSTTLKAELCERGHVPR